MKSLITKLSKDTEQGPVHIALPEEREVRSFQPLQEQLQYVPREHVACGIEHFHSVLILTHVTYLK